MADVLDKAKTFLRECFYPEPDSAKANPIGRFNIPFGSVGRALPSPTDHAANLKILRRDPWLSVAANTIGKNLSGAKLISQELKSVNAEPTWVDDETSQLALLVQNPNKREPMDLLIWKTMVSLITGDAYWIYDPIDNEWHHVHTGIIKPESDADGEVVSYQISRGGKTQTIDANQIIHFKLPNADNEFYGANPIEPGAQHVLLSYLYVRYLNDFFGNGGTPGGILSTPHSGIGTDVKEATRLEWEKFHGGPGNAHRVAILDDDLKWQSVSPPLDQLMVEALYKMPRETILATQGLPPVLAGIFEFANYANSKEQIQIFWNNTILPYQRVISGTINTQFVTEWFGDKFRVYFDVSMIQALREDQNALWTRLKIATGAPFMTQNEAREKIGMPPIDGGDVLYEKPPNGFMASLNSGEPDESRFKSPSPAFIKAAADNSSGSRKQAWAQHHKTVLRLESTMLSKVRKFYDGQLDRILENIDSTSIGNRMNTVFLYNWLTHTKDEADDDIVRIFSITTENQILHEATDGLINQAVIASGQQAIRKVHADITFNINNPKVATTIASFQRRIEYINDTVYDELKDIFQQAYDEGWSITQIEKELRDQYKIFNKVNARRVAMTEMNGMVNGGSHLGYVEAGIEQEEWLSAFLPNSRITHMDADGQIVEINHKFIVGGEMLEYPGDAMNGSAGNVINCHCTIAPVV